jgi:peptide/nickel transport system ATP-binding protein
MSPLLQAESVSVRFPLPRPAADIFLRRPARHLTAVDGVSLSVRPGETLGIVGESGCGKSTLGRALIGLEPLAGGVVRLQDAEVTDALPPDRRRRAQMIFQDPVGALNPLMTVREALAEPLRVHRLLPLEQIPARVDELMRLVGLQSDLAGRRPAELSGGQCQRVGIARALAVEPDLIVADECVSALDVSIQAQVLALLADLRARLGLTLVFISHDLGVVRQFCDRVAVLYLGRVVEEGPVEEVLSRPRHPYTAALRAAAPVMQAGAPLPARLAGEPPSPTDRPPGCPYHPRCPHVFDACRLGSPPGLAGTGGRAVACHLNGGTGLTPQAATTQGDHT